jgi:hypothetical protein
MYGWKRATDEVFGGRGGDFRSVERAVSGGK